MPACGGGGATAWRTAPLRSRSAAPFSPAPRRGGGGSGDRVPGAGELPEVVEGGFEIIDGERSSDVPVQMSGEGAAVPEDGLEATGPGEAAHRDSARCGSGGRPTTLQRYATPIVVACAQTRSGKVAAFYFLAVSGPVAAAAAGGGRRHGQRDQGLLHRSTELRALVATHSGEFAAQINEKAKKFSFQTGLRVVVANKGALMYNQMMDSNLLSKCIFVMVGRVGSRTDLIVQKIEFLNDEEKRSLLLHLLQCNQSVDMASVLQHLLEMKQGADLLWFCLFSKGFPATEIKGDRTHQHDFGMRVHILVGTTGHLVDLFEGSWLSLEAIKYLVMGEAETVLHMGFDIQKTKYVDIMNTPKESESSDKLMCGKLVGNDTSETRRLEKKAFLCWPYISSFRSWSRVYLFAIIFALLIPSSSQIPLIDNTTNTCAAPYLQAPYLDAPYLQFKRPVPAYGAPVFEKPDPECEYLLKLKEECPKQSSDVQGISAAGGFISLLANFGPHLLVRNVGDADPRRVLVVGLSTLLNSEANLLWLEYLFREECASYFSIGFVFIACFWNLVYTIKIWRATTLARKHSITIVLLCALLGILGFVNSTIAGVFGFILILCGHVARIMSVLVYAREFNKITLFWAFCGCASASVLYKYNFEILTLYKIASLVSCGARVIDIVLQMIFYYKGEQHDTNDTLGNETNNMRMPLLSNVVDEQRGGGEPRVILSDQRKADQKEEVMQLGKGVSFSHMFEALQYDGPGDKIKLPPSSFKELSDEFALDKGPMYFRLSKVRDIVPGATMEQDTEEATCCGVLEFTAREGYAELPLHVWNNLFRSDTPEGPDVPLIEVKYVTLPKGTYAKLKPEGAGFSDLPNHRAVLETALRNHATLSENDTVVVNYGQLQYKLKVLELKPASSVSVLETDVEVDIEGSDSVLDNEENQHVLVPLAIGTVESSVVEEGKFRYYKFSVEESASEKVASGRANIEVKIDTDASGGDTDIYVSRHPLVFPTQHRHEWSSHEMGSKVLILKPRDSCLVSGVYSIGVYGFKGISMYQLSVAIKDVSGQTIGEHASAPGSVDVDSVLGKNCNKRHIASRSAHLHEAYCMRHNVACPHDGCGVVLRKEEAVDHVHCNKCGRAFHQREMEKHMKVFHEPLQCPCGVVLEKEDMLQHQSSTCPLRLIVCRFCGDTVHAGGELVDARDRLRNMCEHESICGSMTAPCDSGGRSVMLKEMDIHHIAVHQKS